MVQIQGYANDPWEWLRQYLDAMANAEGGGLDAATAATEFDSPTSMTPDILEEFFEASFANATGFDSLDFDPLEALRSFAETQGSDDLSAQLDDAEDRTQSGQTPWQALMADPELLASLMLMLSEQRKPRPAPTQSANAATAPSAGPSQFQSTQPTNWSGGGGSSGGGSGGGGGGIATSQAASGTGGTGGVNIRGSAPTGDGVFVMGDSLTVGSSDQLENLLGDNLSGISAVEGRHVAEGVEMLENGAANGAGTVVIALGTNDYSMSEEQFAGYIDRAMKAVGPDTAVVWLTVDMPGAQGVNNAIANAAGRHPNLTVQDWQAYADPSWKAGDGVHYNSTGYDARAQWILDNLP